MLVPPSESFKEQYFKRLYRRLQDCIRNKNYKIRDTEKNLRTAAHFGWTIQDQEDVLLSLDSASLQPRADNDWDDPTSTEPVFFFTKTYEGRILYIKITFRILTMPDGHTDFADIKSLHISDYDTK